MKKLCYLGTPVVLLFGFFYGFFAGILTGFRIASDRVAVVVASQRNLPNFYDQSFEFVTDNESVARKRKPLFFIDFIAIILICIPLILFLTLRGTVLGPVYLNRAYIKKIIKANAK